MKKLYFLLLATPLFLNLHCDKDSETPEAQDFCEIYGTEDQRCREQELAKLPPYTETGEGTFGCLVNGKAFIPSTCCGSLFNPPPPIYRSIYYDTSEFNSKSSYFLSARNKVRDEPTHFSISLSSYFKLNDPLPINILLKDWEHDDSSDYFTGRGAIALYSSDPVVSYYTFPETPGFLRINKADTIRQIFAGEFEFICTNGSDTITVTDGRFDMPYIQ